MFQASWGCAIAPTSRWMTYTFARVGAVVALTVEDYFAQKKRWWLRLREKNGKVNEMPCHHKLQSYLGRLYRSGGH